ncbi:aminotransferase class III-fold pyridoxal phosphate-dependent enzyme [Streptomyces zingiberis]|uniref:Aminotransferase class III-fold pyridoxal phosphate-dependent enzyme n=1 Tax=Streptomyces zingiberis TaxID=2053010 RepID=A0ABX1C118_9ACTN|nr:aminotransferase class III-fold pyridoxal phosphate-dependent enzyme [Streptomyces zingiberis]NJQ03601.1 aminotransferase class III-fold pyridoxal phosphate-dependent enzyme [Streptomyces zingiberis]
MSAAPAASHTSGTSPADGGSPASGAAPGGRDADGRKLGRRLRRVFTLLGPMYVKFGQILSTRSDLLPPGAVEELRVLQDTGRAMSPKRTVRTLEKAYGRPLDQVFASFDPVPVASASIAQVHLAVLRDGTGTDRAGTDGTGTHGAGAERTGPTAPPGTRVAVKVVKRGVRTSMRVHLALLTGLVRTAHTLLPPLRRMRMPQRVGEIARLLGEQLSMVNERSNMEVIGANFAGHPFVRIPRAFPELSDDRVLVMEYVEGLKGSEFAQVDLAPRELARRLQDILLTMLYLDGACHGDLHPGNILLSRDGRFTLIDFGIAAYYTEAEKWGLTSFNSAAINHRWELAVRRFTEYFVETGDSAGRPAGRRGRGRGKAADTGTETGARTAANPGAARLLADPGYVEALTAVFVHHFKTASGQWSGTDFFKDVNEVLTRHGVGYTAAYTKGELAMLSCEGFMAQIDPELDIWENTRRFADRYSPALSDAVRERFDAHFATATPTSLALRERARGSLVAATHLDRYFFPSAYPLFVAEGDGAELTDVDGNRYIDLGGGGGPALLGRGHPVVRDALREAAATCNINALGHESEIALAELLTEAFPGADRAVFSNSGTESTLHAVRLCRARRPGARRIAKFEGHFHGFSDQAMVSSWFRVAGPREEPEPIAGSPGTSAAAVRDTLVLQFGHPRSLEILRRHAADVAGVLVEPLPTTSGQIDREYLTALRELCTELDIPLVFDEVVSGFRVAYGGVQTLTGITPDLTVLGKVIGGGLPCGALVGKAEVIEYGRATGDPFRDAEERGFLGGTMSGNHLTCTTGLAALRHLRDHPEIYRELERRTGLLADGLRGAAAAHGVPLRLTARHSVFSLTFTHKDPAYFRDTLHGVNFQATMVLAYWMRMYGVYLPELHAFLLSAAHTDAQVAEVVRVFDRAVGEMKEAGLFVL